VQRISRLNLQWYHILIILAANSVITRYKSNGYFVL